MAIKAGNYPLSIRRGDTGSWKFKLEDVVGGVSSPIDISSWTFTGRALWDQKTIWLTLPITVIDGPNGEFGFSINKSTSEGLIPVGSIPPEDSTYEIQASFDNGGDTEVATILEGTFTVIQDIVRPT